MLRSHLGVLGLRKSAKRAFEQGSADWSFKSALWDALLDWHLDQNTESILFLTNESNQPARIGFQVTTQGIHYYLTQLKLQPHETRAINIRLLRDVQLADFRKNKIPATATDGGVSWIRLDNVPVMGRLLVITRHAGMSSSYAYRLLRNMERSLLSLLTGLPQ